MDLTIERRSLGWCMQYEISGFQFRDLDELKSMEYFDLRDKLIEILDSKEDGLGTYLAHCVGIRSIQFSGTKVLLKTNL